MGKLNKIYHIVYFLSWQNQVVFVGCCPLHEIKDLPDANSNSMWAEYNLTDYGFEIVATKPTREAAEAMQALHIATYKPPCNLMGKPVTPKTRQFTRVRCIDTGQEFKSCAEAAKVMNVRASNLSKHLDGEPGYRTVGGHTFERIIEDAPIPPEPPASDHTQRVRWASAPAELPTEQVRYETVDIAAEQHGIDRETMIAHLDRRTGWQDMCNGETFRWAGKA